MLWWELFSKSPSLQKKLISAVFKDNRSLGHYFRTTKVNNNFLKCGTTNKLYRSYCTSGFGVWIGLGFFLNALIHHFKSWPKELLQPRVISSWSHPHKVLHAMSQHTWFYTGLSTEGQWQSAGRQNVRQCVELKRGKHFQRVFLLLSGFKPLKWKRWQHEKHQMLPGRPTNLIHSRWYNKHLKPRRKITGSCLL